jgi:hypothetical protein
MNSHKMHKETANPEPPAVVFFVAKKAGLE